MALDAKRIAKNTQKLRKILKRGSKLLNPEDVHDLRTSIRRVEAAIDAFQLSSKRNEKRLLRCLGRIRKRAGKVRDMDVLTSDLAATRFEGHRDCVTMLIEHFGAQRHRRAKRLKTLIGRYEEEARRRLQRTSDRFESMLVKKSSTVGQDGRQAAAALALRLSADMASPPTLNHSNLHPYRLKVKQLRYILQMAEADSNKPFIDALGSSKDAIGDWHDWEELIAIAGKVIDHEGQCPVLSKLRKTGREKYELALTITNKMRHEYLKPSRSTRSGLSGQPALESAAAIAS